ncbi:MAG: DUF2209 domain-containing protein [Methanothrix harundinacea]|uniref:Uncharacterized protein n=1 Tax=Methanothrix harundinacea TaxID=301375 RepID=A0A101FTY0_9EURY|nr:MAG: Uncharacterized protein XD72_1228 [Methanothrix harundinacea]KUK95729.1 MAG: Uncharacterized protein XE07_1669 [Methanothrix harundinacea]MCP1392547.1 DUF2209 domain-containing protein [Methanothrix harundinacea]
MDVVAVDISGRHAVAGRYIMVSASVAARISPEGIERTWRIRLVPLVAESVEMEVVIGLIEDSIRGQPGVVLAERGDLYNLARWRVESILGREFKYPESRGERRAMELAHHASFAGRKLVLRLMDEELGSRESKIAGGT